MARESVYLRDKCAALHQALRFFTASSFGQRRNEKLVSFLGQLDFWDWEVENLIFSFTNFAERRQAWGSLPELRQLLARNRIMVEPKVLRGLGEGHRYEQWYRESHEVVAPVAALNEVLDVWNEILAECEAGLLSRYATQAEALALAGCQRDLARYRKARMDG